MDNKVFKRTAASLAILLMVALIGSACAPAATPQPVNDLATSDAAMGKTVDALRVQLNQTATAEKNVLIEQATGIAQTQTAAVTPTPTGTSTPTPNLQQTQEASAMWVKVQQYVKDNYLPSTSGVYQRLHDQLRFYAKAGYYDTTATGITLDDFAFESDVAWENTTATTGDHTAGCGLSFHSDGNKNYILAHLGLDGNVYMGAVVNGEFHLLGKSPYGKVEVSQGSAHIALVVSGNHYAFFVNDKKILQAKSETDRKMGAFSYVVFSGSDKGVGTTCKFTHIDLWTVKP